MKQLIGWVCVSNKFLSTLAKVPMLEWPGSDVDRAQRLMDQGPEAPTACSSSYFLGVDWGWPRVRPFLPGRPLTFDERCGQCLAGTRLCSCRAGSWVGAGQGSQGSCPQASAAQAASKASAGSPGPAAPALLRCVCASMSPGPRRRAGAATASSPACAQRDCRCQALPGEPRGCGAVSFKLTFRFVAV